MVTRRSRSRSRPPAHGDASWQKSKSTGWNWTRDPSCITAANRRHIVPVRPELRRQCAYIRASQREPWRWGGGWLLPCFAGLSEFYKVSVNSRDKLQATVPQPPLHRGGSVDLRLSGQRRTLTIPTEPARLFTVCICTVIKIQEWKQG